MTMKKIKFRYYWKSPENAIKKYEYDIDELEGKDVAYVIADYEASDWKLLSRSQYTGIKDQNGKEIYEGDIVKYDKEVYGIIIRDRHCFTIKCFYCHSLDFIEAPGMEVVGNIYENPDMIKNTEKQYNPDDPVGIPGPLGVSDDTIIHKEIVKCAIALRKAQMVYIYGRYLDEENPQEILEGHPFLVAMNELSLLDDFFNNDRPNKKLFSSVNQLKVIPLPSSREIREEE